MNKKLYSILVAIGIVSSGFAQTNTAEKVSYMQEYLNNIRSNLFDLRALTDSSKTITLLDSLDLLIEKVDLEVNQIVIPAVEPSLTSAEPEPAPEEVTNGGSEAIEDRVVEYKREEPEMNLGMGGAGKFDYLSMLKTKLYFNFGLNGLQEQNAGNATGPEVNATKSWFWAIGFKRPIRLSKNSDRLRLYYGIDYLGNSYSIENGLRLYNNSESKPDFQQVDSLSNNNYLNVGYIRLPIELNVKLSSKFKLGVGVFAGYRVRSVQKLKFRKNNENIEEFRYGNFGLNDFCYGTNVSIGYGSFNLLGTYNFSNLLKSNTVYDYKPYSLGISLVF